MPMALPSPFTNRTMRPNAPTCTSAQIPRSSGLIRPSPVTGVGSVNTRPAPPIARVARWTKCQSLTKPSVLEYWHIGETTIRFVSVRSRKVIGSKRCGIALHCAKHEAGEESRHVREFARGPELGLHFLPLGDGGFSIMFTGM